jgi:hypothetical protein
MIKVSGSLEHTNRGMSTGNGFSQENMMLKVEETVESWQSIRTETSCLLPCIKMGKSMVASLPSTKMAEEKLKNALRVIGTEFQNMYLLIILYGPTYTIKVS